MSQEDVGTPSPLLPSEQVPPPANEDTMKHLRRTVDETKVNIQCVYLTVLISLLFVVVFMLVYSASSLYQIKHALYGALEIKPWLGNWENNFKNLTTLDDLDRYMRMVLIPTVAESLYFLDFNYIIGFRFNLKRGLQVNNTVDKFADDFPYVFSRSDFSYDKQNPGEMTDDYYLWQYSVKDSFAHAGAYTEELILTDAEDLSADFFTYRWRLMRLYWITERTTSIVIEVLLQNSNLRVTVYYYQVFEMLIPGKMISHSHLVGSYPEMLGANKELNTWISILGAVVVIECLVRLYRSVKIAHRCIRVALRERRNDLESYELLGILTLILQICAIILIGVTLVQYADDLDLPLTSLSDVDPLITQLLNFRSYIRISAIAVIFIFLRAIFLLKGNFPSFSIIFDTFTSVKNSLLYFALIVFLLLFFFGVAGFQLFGLYHPKFCSLQESMLTLLVMALGKTDLDSLINTRSSFAGVFFIIFAMTFTFVMLNIFLAMLMATFTELRKRNQMFILAKASLLAKEAKSLKERWMNCLFCRRPKRNSMELAKKYAILQADLTIDATDKERQMKEIQVTLLQEQKPKLQDILKYNMSQLEVFRRIMTVSTRKLKTREQYIEELINEINDIEEKNRKKREEQLKLESDKWYISAMIKDMLLYSCFIALFVTMVYYRSRVEDKFLLEENVRRLILDFEFVSTKGVTLTFNDLVTPDMGYSWIEQVFPEVATKFAESITGKFIGTQTTRITYQRSKPEENTYSGTKDIFPYVRDKEPPSQRPLDKSGTPDDTRNFTSTIAPDYTYVYIKDRSFRGYGGYVSYLSADIEFATLQLKSVRVDQLLGNFSKALIGDFALYSGNTQLILLCAIGLMRTESGSIIPQVLTRSFEPEIYPSGNTARPALDILFILFLLYYFYRAFREWYVCFKELHSKLRRSMAEKRLFQEVMLEIQDLEMITTSGCDEILHSIKQVFEFIFDYLVMFLRSFWRFLQRDVFHVLDVVFLALSVAMLVYMGKMLFSDFRKNFSLPDDMDKENLSDLWTLADWDMNYRIVSSINCLIVFLRMLKNFRFSKRLSILTEVLDSAALDIIFFLAVFTIILIAFFIMSYALLGHEERVYRDLNESFLSMYFMLLGDISTDGYLSADNKVGGLLVVVFLLAYNLFLMNMFTAIIVAHFNNVMEMNRNAEHVGLVTAVKRMIVGYVKKIGAGKLKNCLERCLKRKEKKEETEEEEGNGQEEASFLSDSEDTFPAKGSFVHGSDPNKWILSLEQRLWEVSRQTLDLVRLKSKATSLEKSFSRFSLKLDIASVAFITKELWLQEQSMKKKMYLWRQLTMINETAQMREHELQLVGKDPRQPHAQHSLSVVQRAIWEAASMEMKLQLWTDKIGFDSKERADLWNFTLFNPGLFGKEAADWDVSVQLSVQKELVELDLSSEPIKFKPELSSFLSSFSASQRRYSAFFRLNSPDIHLNLLSFFTESNDERMTLWLSLSDQERALLFLNNRDHVEARMLSYLMFESEGNHALRMEILDLSMSELVDAKIYDKHVRLAEYQAENVVMNQVKERWNAAKSDAEAMLEYRVLMKKKKEARVTLLEHKTDYLKELMEKEQLMKE